MKVGVLGSGIVGQVLGAGFTKHGHQVMMGTRKPQEEDVRTWLAKTPGASAGTFAEASRFGDDCGGVIASRALEPLGMLWCIRGFRSNQWTHAFKLLTH